jgi:hypothetical protein
MTFNNSPRLLAGGKFLSSAMNLENRTAAVTGSESGTPHRDHRGPWMEWSGCTGLASVDSTCRECVTAHYREVLQLATLL